ncbi:DUF4030 domain-containing protein [Gracilibacillus caseinilyticus]|uniref:DUF4030 domain-containing protein n=1 Tax=Gracilibacillus caseinilyticus TaxID=2932256 RepID=A0ABY4EWW0_9BACI|nr:DUF4030 domain-containing protein [Gracilibacillus caseinilyticus]UOQ48440.1 DUF4030 domain-containing protein [Gracilibacillus caseinilyticus]
MKNKILLVIVTLTFVIIFIWFQNNSNETNENDITISESHASAEQAFENFLHEKSKDYEYMDYGIIADPNSAYSSVTILTSSKVDVIELEEVINKKIQDLNLNYHVTINQQDLSKVKTEKNWSNIASAASKYLEEKKHIENIQVLKSVNTSNMKVGLVIKNHSQLPNKSIKKHIEEFLHTPEMKKLINNHPYTVRVINE